MTKLREILIAILTGILVLVCCFAIREFFSAPYTDVEIQESLVDTWEVNAIFTMAALAVVLPAGALSAVLAWRGTRLSKLLAGLAVAFAILTSALLVSSHAELTQRTTRLTGQEFGGLFGLGLGP